MFKPANHRIRYYNNPNKAKSQTLYPEHTCKYKHPKPPSTKAVKRKHPNTKQLNPNPKPSLIKIITQTNHSCTTNQPTILEPHNTVKLNKHKPTAHKQFQPSELELNPSIVPKTRGRQPKLKPQKHHNHQSTKNAQHSTKSKQHNT